MAGNQQNSQQNTQQYQQQNEQKATPDTQAGTQPQGQQQEAGQDNFDGLEGKKPEELTPEELRLMADTMPGEGPGD